MDTSSLCSKMVLFASLSLSRIWFERGEVVGDDVHLSYMELVDNLDFKKKNYNLID